MSRASCCHQRRLRAIAEAGVRNGIEYVEVRDRDEADPGLRQRTLYVRLLQPVPAGLGGGNVTITGGERVPEVAVTWAAPADALPASVSPPQQAELVAGLADPQRVLVVRTDARGDFSRYTLRLVAGAGSDAPPAGFDPMLTEVDLSFKVECPSDFDCALHEHCPPTAADPPPIDYLARDYEGLRRQMLERISLLSPGWATRNPADVGVTLVELLAYVADELSYRQDAITTEAYLGTARSRISLRRHARLVDFRVHEGCNARAWVRLGTDEPSLELPAGTTLLSRVPQLPPHLEPGSRDHERALAADPVVFQTVDDAVLHADQDELLFWTWGQEHCCLPRGATSATLYGAPASLRAGDLLVLAETRSPTTLAEALADPALTEEEALARATADADPERRHAVRLVDVRTTEDPSGGLFDPATDPADPVPVTEITWARADALPFPLCLDAGGPEWPTAHAWGNVVLADHGRGVAAEELPVVPAPTLTRVAAGRTAHCDDDQGVPVPVRYRPTLAQRPLTHGTAEPPPVAFEATVTAALEAELGSAAFGPALQALLAGHGLFLGASATAVRGTAPRWSLGDGTTVVRLDRDGDTLRAVVDPAAAAAATTVDPRAAMPAIRLVSDPATAAAPWTPRRDLLASGPGHRVFTVESEHDGTTQLRFGDDQHGQRPDPGTTFVASYRVGNGVDGNLGAGALAHVVTMVAGVTSVDNPLPATGGVDPESAEQVRRDAPQAFRVQQRAVTEEDYAEVAERMDGVERATATMRWTGSWHTVFVTADRAGGEPVDPPFERALRDHLERFRMARHDLEVDGPRFVPVELGITVCVEDGHLRSHVARAVRDVLSDRALPDGTQGLFHPDLLTFGRSVHLSSVYAAVQAVPGVASLEVTTFRRQREPATSGLATGELPMGRLEVPRLDDDPNFPERGILHLELGGGL